MRTALTASVRTQEQMNQLYLENIAKQIAGECRITLDTVRNHFSPQSFSKQVFQDVLMRVVRMNPQTLGRILAYGLAPGASDTHEKFTANGRRITSMSEAWFGTVENTVTGMMLLEWSATAVVVAAIYDYFNLTLVAHSFINSVHRQHGSPPPYPPRPVRSGR
ncbi:hypothetical protein KW782_01320 [Candidatus Parcubacteria bacterium]|nr:hypothetical protein [Candidatus Parcubacteria bacterium]